MGQITFSAKARFLLVIGALKYAPLAAYEPLQIRRAFLFVRFEAAIQERLTHLRNATAFVECHLLKIRLKPFCDPERKRSFLRHAIHCIDNELCTKETVTLSLYVLYCVYEDEKVNGRPAMHRATKFERNRQLARKLWNHVSPIALQALSELTTKHSLSVAAGDLLLLEERWYVTHTGLLGLAHRKRCSGIQVQPVPKFCDQSASRWAFRATVYKTRTSRGFVGYGDANPSNVSPVMHGVEMRVAETRAVNRALRKAYGIGVCSVEEIGSRVGPEQSHYQSNRIPPQPANGNYGGPKVRDRLCQIIRQHQLDPNLVKSYATDFCGVKTLREATREQVENFVAHLADWAEKDRNALLCQLNSYLPAKGSAA